MSLSSGIYRISNVGNDKYRLAFYDSDTVKANDSSNVTVEIKNQSGGQMIRFNDSGVNPSTSDWFGYGTNLKARCSTYSSPKANPSYSESDSRYRIKVWNEDAAWTLPSSPSNPSDIYLEPAEGQKGQLWKIVKA
ncbi:hypothetical protein RHS03_05362, partial [Rhizoctonia solani]|uniref:Uncharacterized protein n=1 Tax=Rhizoctonia solani TaxID=456999 RepID=A0A8H7IHN8_9AGAM